MYSIEINQTVCYDDTQIDDASYRLIDYKLVMEDNKAGSLTMVVPPTNRAYTYCLPPIIKHRPLVRVWMENEVIWVGRAVSVKIDFWKRANVFCEGALSWLADALYEGLERTRVYNTRDVAGTKIDGALSGYKRNIGDDYAVFKIENGNLTMEIDGEADWSPLEAGQDYGYAPQQTPDTSKTCLQRITDLLKRYGGHFQTEYEDGYPTLAWYADLWGNNTRGTYTQTANFGINLLDYVKSYTTDGIFTVLRPYGAIKDNAPKIEAEKIPVFSATTQLQGYRRINRNGVVEESPSVLQNVSNSVEIVKGRKYYYSGHMRGNFSLFVITDSMGNIHYVKSSHGGETFPSTEIRTFTNVEIPIPEYALAGGFRIRCGFWQDTAYETEKSVTLFDYSNLYYVEEDQSTNADEYRVTLLDHGAQDQTYPINNLVDQYGWIERRIDFPNINHADGLYEATRATAFMIQNDYFAPESITVGLLDMAYFIQSDAPRVGMALVGSAILSDGSTRVPPLKLYDGVRVVSDPHHVDTVMYVTKIELSINPANSKYTLGVSKEKGISALVGG